MGNASTSLKQHLDVGSSSGSLKHHMETAEKTGALCFSGQKLTQFPEQLQRVASRLRNLDLSANRLVSLPASLGDFGQLRNLHLQANRLTSLPAEIGQLTRLESLHVEQNRLASLPSSLGALSNLKELSASQNALQVFPEWVLGLRRLDRLALAQNQIDRLPADMSSLTAMEVDLNQNRLATLPPSLARCTRLKTLRLEENCLPLEQISEELLGQSSVTTLTVAGNLFDERKLPEQPGHDKYMERYAAIRRKLD